MSAVVDHAITGPRLHLAPPVGEEGRVDAVIAPWAAMLGRPPAGLQLFGLSPPLLEHYAAGIDYYMHHPRLGAVLRTFIRYLVSWRGACTYCVDLNEAFLANAGIDLAVARAARNDPRAAPLEPAEQALLLFALDVVERPATVDAARIDALRHAGWSDRDIFDAAWHAAQNRAFGMVAEAFGLPPEGLVAA